VSDSDWLKQVDQQLYHVQRQDKLALKKLYTLTATKLLGLITRVVNDRHEAEDILQEVFVKVWQQANQYTGSGSAWGWVCVMARHRAIDRLRSLKNRSYESTDELPELLEQLTELNDMSDNHWLGQCLQKLKPRPKEAILLSCLKGYSHRELSAELSAPLGTVKAWVRRGLQELKECLAA
jgi:RNA polymerase sigma-70 factor (ECF subfamily)